jgi:hypothetical protein
MRETPKGIEYHGPQCQHHLHGRCGRCAYPRMAVTLQYISSPSLPIGLEAAFQHRQRERRRTNDGGKHHRKLLRRIRVKELMATQPRRVSAYCRGI